MFTAFVKEIEERQAHSSEVVEQTGQTAPKERTQAQW
jgi:hypothetical protein